MARVNRRTKTCTMTGLRFPVSQFYRNTNTVDGYHPYSKVADNFRRRLKDTNVTTMDLRELFKDKIIVGAKGKYLPISITLNDEVDQFGNNGPVIVEQTKEEREAKVGKVYLGNARVVWTNGQNVEAAPRMDQPKAMPKAAPAEETDLPF